MSILPPPLPPTLPGSRVQGHLRAFQTDPLGFFATLHAAAQARTADLLTFRLGPQRLYYVASATLADAVLAQADIFRQTAQGHKYLRPLIGQGLILTEPPAHRPQRQQIAPTFRHDRLQSYGASMVRWADQCQRTWRASDAFDVGAAMTTMTWGIVAEALFGTTIDRVAAEAVRQALRGALDHISWQMSHPLTPPAAIPTPRNRRYQRHLATLRATVAQVLAAPQPPPGIAPPGGAAPPRNLLTLLQDAGVPAAQLRDEAMTFLLAGHETTATALTWTVLLLAQHPSIATQLEAELDTVLAGRLPTYADLARLPYTVQVFKEALRLYPPAALIVKQTPTPAQLGPYHLPAGASLMIMTYMLHRDARYWPDPDRVDPTRHDPRPSWRPQAGFLAFGGGERSCIGAGFALIEGALCLATIAQQVRFHLPAGARPPAPVLGMTLHPPPDLRLVVERRPPFTPDAP